MEDVIGFIGYGLDTDERGFITFCKIPSKIIKNKDAKYCVAQLSLCFKQWLELHNPETTAETLLKELDITII